MNIKVLRSQSGFTIIELMFVVMIVAILAAAAIPFYRQYAVRNFESQAQARMQQLEIELNRWRATALTYKGFKPRKVASDGTISHGYDDGGGVPDNTVIYVPVGTDATNYRYKITLVDANTSSSLVPANTAYSTAGNSWRMLAEPKYTGITQDADIIMTSSTGMQCKSKDRTIRIISLNCGINQQVW